MDKASCEDLKCPSPLCPQTHTLPDLPSKASRRGYMPFPEYLRHKPSFISQGALWKLVSVWLNSPYSTLWMSICFNASWPVIRIFCFPNVKRNNILRNQGKSLCTQHTNTFCRIIHTSKELFWFHSPFPWNPYPKFWLRNYLRIHRESKINVFLQCATLKSDIIFIPSFSHIF